MRIEGSTPAFPLAYGVSFTNFITDNTCADGTPCEDLENLKARKAKGEQGLDTAIRKKEDECTLYNTGDWLPRGPGARRWLAEDGETPTKPTPRAPTEGTEPVKPTRPIRPSVDPNKAESKRLEPADM